MSLYSNSAFGPAFKTIKRMGTQTEPNYLFGSFDYSTQPFLFNITNLVLTSNVVTATVSIISGGGGSSPGVPNAIPQVGAKAGVRGASNAAYNADPVTVTGVSYDTTTGTGTITYALTHANIGTAVASGQMVVQAYEQGDIVVSGSASIPISLIFTPDESDNSRSLFGEARWSGTSPTAATVVLQVANVDDDARYLTIQNVQGCAPGAVVAASDALATIASSAVTQGGAQYSFIMGKFIRAKVLSMTGGDGTTALVVTLFA
jgi:hypothetical protein